MRLEDEIEWRSLPISVQIEYWNRRLVSSLDCLMDVSSDRSTLIKLMRKIKNPENDVLRTILGEANGT